MYRQQRHALQWQQKPVHRPECPDTSYFGVPSASPAVGSPSILLDLTTRPVLSDSLRLRLGLESGGGGGHREVTPLEWARAGQVKLLRVARPESNGGDPQPPGSESLWTRGHH